MPYRPLTLGAAAVSAALLTLGAVALFAPRDTATNPQPLKPPPGESLRLQPPAPRPVAADPAAVAKALTGAALLEGDRVLADALAAELERKGVPTYKASVDVPLNDNAAQAVRDELKAWLAVKMAGLGFTEAPGKPTVLWMVHIDPVDGGRYKVEAIVRSGGEAKFQRAFELPFEYTADRVARTMGPAFAPPAAR